MQALVLGLTDITSKREDNFKQSKEFLPERWLRHKPYGKMNPFASLPFSHGTRMCIGRRIAEQEIYTLLIRVNLFSTIICFNLQIIILKHLLVKYD